MSDIALPRNRVPGVPLGGRLLGDERLAKLAGRGNEQAFAALYERHHQAIYRYCRSILRNDQDAQDAMQSAMMRAYAALRSHERELAVKPWLFRIAHNESISILRKRRPQDELSDAYEQPGAEVQGTLETRERLATLLADLQALPERQRGALLMRELSGLSIEQIAGALSMSPGAAKQALFEARNSLHELSEGRTMPCEQVREAISQRDGRVLRSRRIRSHMRACEECREFRAAIGARSADLAALAPPLPTSVASALLAHLLAHGSGHSSGGAAMAGSGAGSAAVSGAPGSGALGSGAAGGSASLAGHLATGSLLGKGVAGVAVLALAAAGTAHFATSSHRSKSTRSPASPGLTTPASTTDASGSPTGQADSGRGARTSTATSRPAPGPASNGAPSSVGRASGQGTGANADRQQGASRRTIATFGHSHQPGQGSERANAPGSPRSTDRPASRRRTAGRSTQHPHRPNSGSRSRSRPRGSSHTSPSHALTRRKPPPKTAKAPAHPPAGSDRAPTAQENAGLTHEQTEVRRGATTTRIGG